MARTRLVLVALFSATIGVLFANHFAHAHQPVGLTRPLTVTPVPELDGHDGGVHAAFIKDNKTGECWLWLKESGQGSALAQAKESACNYIGQRRRQARS